MRNRRLHRKILHLREVARRRKLTSGERAILKFAESYTASEDVQFSGVLPKGTRSAAEDEDETRTCCSACEYESTDTEAKFCASCGEKLADVEDEDERRTDEYEVPPVGDRGSRDSSKNLDDETNDLGLTGWKGQDTPKHSERVGAGEAIKTFRSSYRKARESATGSVTRSRGF